MKKKNFIMIGCIAAVLLIACLIFIFVLSKGSKISITFMDDGKTISSVKIKKNESVDFPDIKKDGYNLEGWYLENNKVNTNTRFKTDSILIAKWINVDADVMVITFDANGGTSIDSITVECDSVLDLPTPVRDGYKFLDWRDINDVVISNETKLVCEDITLKANWEKIEEKKEETKKEEPKTTVEEKKEETVVPAKKEYTCPDGYTLNGEKCIIEEAAKLKCDGERKFEYDDKCVTINYAARKDAKASCGKTTVHTGGGHTEEVQGELFKMGTNFCFFKVVTTSDEQSQTSCTSRGHKWNSQNNKCYYYRGDANQFVTSTCDHLSGYAYITNPNDYQGVNGLNGGCYPLSDKTKYCADGYTLNGDKCVKTVDATLK